MDDAFVDGAIIGGAIVWDHQRRLLREREEELQVAREERDALEERALLDGGDVDDVDDLDDLDEPAASDDLAEFDAMAGYGVEPWALEQYGPDPDDDVDGGLSPDTDGFDGGWDEFDDLDD